MPASSAPPPPYSAPSQTPGGIPARSARFRRGSRGGRVPPAATDIPKIGVVEVDPNFRPRIDLVPTKPPAAPVTSDPSSGEGRRGAGQGRGRSPAGNREERGERGERGGRNRRGGRGRARGGRGGQGGSRERDDRPPRSETSPPSAPAAPPATPPAPPPAPTPRPRAAEPEPDGESFWSKVKRGLTGGA